MNNNQILKYTNAFHFESGHSIKELTIAYSTYGKLNATQDNVIWVCHALTANSEAVNWWDGLIGEGKLYDTSKYYIVCANILGSCYGTSGPLEINPETGIPYYLSFPQFTIRDLVAAHEILRKHLGITKIHTCIGGSLGGQQAMEWAITNPSLIENLVLMATNAQHSPWGIAFNEAQRMAIAADPTWGNESANAGQAGMAAARAIALLSYRNYHTYLHSQSEDNSEKTDDFKASSYQKYQGEKLVKRFNTHSYWYLSKAMDSHNVGRGRGGAEKALRLIKSKTLLVGILTDVLFPIEEQVFLSNNIPGASYHQIDSLFGHDGFLIETTRIEEGIRTFYKSHEKITNA
ncbi:MAG TPA: homoserine O-acetyltransferase [Cytophagaceae bacterium]|nr:homoserine O-acetyltransferase [Cytophagaceae bacterium]